MQVRRDHVGVSGELRAYSCLGPLRDRVLRHASRPRGRGVVVMRRRQMKQSWAISLAAIFLAACASAPPPPPQSSNALLRDELFKAPSERISPDDVFAVSDEMRSFLRNDIAADLNIKGSRQGLVDALYTVGQLKLEYDTLLTRNAAQAFHARSGNCLSLVIMTAAFAKELGLPVRFQNAWASETWSRNGGVNYFIGHVNLTLGVRSYEQGFGRVGTDQLTVDFLPPQETRGMSTRVIDEKTIVAMYMNNRAAESFAQGKLDDAYGWARAAVLYDPSFLISFNTLGVIYQRHGNYPEAEKVLTLALEKEPTNTHVLSNLTSVMIAQGRVGEARVLAQRLEQLEPDPPFAFLDRGLTALSSGDYKAAREQFRKEISRAPYNDELHYWLALAYVGLGETDQAKRELAKALEYVTSRKNHELYAAKLDRLRSNAIR
jgi:Tfp pilus assembly protein PilF